MLEIPVGMVVYSYIRRPVPLPGEGHVGDVR